MEDDPPGPDGANTPESLLPYDDWTEAALRQVMLRALQHAATHGLPGNHHFYVTFRTDHPGAAVPPRLKAQYPQEMTIVLQHQFWDLAPGEMAASCTSRRRLSLQMRQHGLRAAPLRTSNTTPSCPASRRAATSRGLMSKIPVAMSSLTSGRITAVTTRAGETS